MGNLQQHFGLDVTSPTLEKDFQPAIKANNFRSLSLNKTLLSQLLLSAPMEQSAEAKTNPLVIEFPLPNGNMETFTVVESPIMAKGLADKYPEIRTYAGRSMENGRSLLRFDLTHKGFHAMVLAGEETWYIDPFTMEDTGEYMSYFKKDFETNQTFECHLETDELAMDEEEKNLGPNPVGDELRTYRLAMSATGEYTQFHGGTVEDGMAAIVTMMNRVNGVYERDISVRMILIENNDTLVFTNPNTDPFTTNTFANLDLNQNTVDQRIGTANYDVGHVVGGAGGGGVANLGAVCNSDNKARGVTALPSPVGDPFWIDYVAHELGHQFRGNHTFNGTLGSCQDNGANTNSYEPGSGTSIMAYAGICGGHNTQPNSDDHFHVASFDEMANFTLTGGGSGCAEVIPTGNTHPIVDAGPSGFVIPISTPFELEASATDMEGDSLTFCWEQHDIGPRGAPNNPEGNAPLFRTFSPRNDSVRTFPRISAIVNNTSSLGEVLPNYTRNMSFRCTVRDNFGFGGGADYDEMTMSVSDQAGPFRVTSQNDGGTWTSGAFETVTWNVANTDQAPVNATNVNIYLSIDGGFTYPIVLAENLPNSGSASILVPSGLEEPSCRVKVKGAGNVFFDINNSNIAIQAPAEAGISTSVSPSNLTVCGGTDASFSISISSLLGFSDTLSVSQVGSIEGLTVSIDSTEVVAPAEINVNITGTENLSSGTYPIEFEFAGSTVNEVVTFVLEVFESAPGVVSLNSPENGTVDVSTFTIFNWETLASAQSYTLEISDDPEFNDIIFTQSGIEVDSFELEEQLVDSTTYYWRIRGANTVCGEGANSQIFFFTTEAFRCDIFVSDELPLPYTNFPFVNSKVEINQDLSIRDINLLNVQGTKDFGNALEFRFVSPEGVSLLLEPDDCEIGINYDISFDSESPLGSNTPCPFTNGLPYRPAESLSRFYNMSSEGQWRLLVYNGNQPNELTYWELEICYAVNATSSEELKSTVNNFKLFPNPASNQVNIEVSFEVSQSANLQVRNAFGQLLKQYDWGNLEAGVHLLETEVQDLPAGMYFFQIVSDQNELLATERLIKQ